MTLNSVCHCALTFNSSNIHTITLQASRINFSRLGIRATFVLATLFSSAFLFASVLHAEDLRASDALPIESTQSATPIAKGAVLALATGYGVSGAVLNLGDTHHRTMGKFALSYRILNDLSIALQFDGRYDFHRGDDGKDSGGVGDPRLFVRYRNSISDTISWGSRVGLWAPGNSAPSFVSAALGFEALSIVTYDSPQNRIQISGNLGYRLDRSAASISGVDKLSKADQLSLGISDYNAILFRVGMSYQIAKLSLFSEWNLDLLHGAKKPKFRHSPMGVGLGMRYLVSDSISAFVHTGIRINKVRSVDVGVRLIPFQPRVRFLMGLTMKLGTQKQMPGPQLEPAPPVNLEPAPIPTYSLEGIVQYSDTPISGAVVVCRGSNGEATEFQTGEDGSFSIASLPVGKTELTIQADGYDTESQVITLTKNQNDLRIVLSPKLPPGQLRGVIRSFRGKPLKATLTILPTNTVIKTMADGNFEVDLPPGDYELAVSSKGYKSQVRQLHIDEDGVTIVNIDLQK